MEDDLLTKTRFINWSTAGCSVVWFDYHHHYDDHYDHYHHPQSSSLSSYLLSSWKPCGIFHLVPSGYIWLFLSRFEGECAEPIMAGAPNQSWPGSAPVIVQLSLIFTQPCRAKRRDKSALAKFASMENGLLTKTRFTN